jgi:carbamoyltransferase
LNVLGVTSPVSWNNAAAFVRDGVLVATAEEERFNRIKQSPRIPPIQAAQYCIRAAGIDADEVDAIAVGFQGPVMYTLKQLWTHLRAGEYRHLAFTVPGGLEYAMLHVKFRNELLAAEPGLRGKPWVFVPHHLAHAASCYRVSGFDRANVITVDGNGEDDSGITAIADGDSIRIVKRRSIAESLGVYYGNVTELLGFRRHIDEGKVMGLAAFGDPTYDITGVRVDQMDYSIDRRYNYAKFWQDFPIRRSPGSDIEDVHKNFAASAQLKLEDAGIALARGAHEISGYRQLCLSGGVALNCDMNARMLSAECVDDIFIQPASHDAGTALGAALEVAARHGEPSGFVMEHAYWGPEYSNEEIQAFLDEAKIAYSRPPDIEQAVAESLAAGDIIGWFQGRMEIGPRALGGRSILANPTLPEMKDLVNERVKHREGWRPFAPSMLEEEAANLVYDSHPSPFMLLTFTVRPEWRERLSAAMHIDNTVRSQTVSSKTNPRYHGMISKFHALTGVPAVLNTSFNDQGEPIVMTPQDAVRCFFSTGLDRLAIGDFLVSKDRPDIS